ncbi:collagen binding domain-containing protein, partial [Pseudomonadota bacterium]
GDDQLPLPSTLPSAWLQFEGAPTDVGHVNIWDAAGHYVDSAGVDGSGNWSSPLLDSGTYYVTAPGEEFGMVSQLYNGLSCPQEFCDVTTGDPVVLSNSDETGIDFNLVAFSADWTISGTVLDNNSNPLGGAVRLFDPMGNYMGEFWFDEFGNYQTNPVANGTYFVVTIHTGDMLDEAWDNIPCENMTCDIPASTPIVVDGANRTGIDFMLGPIVQGGRISGHVGDGSDSPLPPVMVVIKNHKGEHVFETFTDPNGNYHSDLLATDSYFVHTINEPFGMGRELYDDVSCDPSGLCDDPGFVTSQGNAVMIDGADETGIDFILEVPVGGMISGRVGDADIGIPLPDVHMNLLNEFGNQLTYTNTDALGNYYFAGLEDGNYKVIAIGVPTRYSSELYGGEHCNNWECDLNTAGTVITINGGAVSADRDIELDYVGTRLLITVKRSDTGEPVSSLYAWAGIDLYNSAGQYMLGRGANSAGHVQFHPRNPNEFYLVFTNDWDFHGLLNEAWKDIRCTHNCNPLDIGATKITAVEGTTVIFDFIVDPEVAFKDGFE